MNCQDIFRIADSGSFGGLNEGQRHEAEAHALSCRRCAAVWGAHAGLAALSVPPMPMTLSTRCRTLAAAALQSRKNLSPRRYIISGGLVAIAAAAGILLLSLRGRHAPESRSTHAAAVADAAPSAPLAEPVAAAATAFPVSKEEIKVQPRTTLPLLPPPAQFDRHALQDLALEKLVQRHPELVDGPEMEADSYFIAAMTMRTDGEVLSSAVRASSGINGYEIDHELDMTVPRDGGDSLLPHYAKHAMVPDGRFLRADLSIKLLAVSPGFNGSRSSTQVRKILGDRYNYLLLPASGGVSNRLTVLLSEDGRVLREAVEPESRDITQGPAIRADDPRDVAAYAERIATRLDIDVKQIGLMGTTTVEEGTIKLEDNGTPGGYVDDKRRVLLVRYAWARGSGESGPTLGQNAVTKPAVDPTSALAIVEQQIPDAFTAKDQAAGVPMVVLTAKGDVIKAGRVQQYGTPGMMAAQLVPGMKTPTSTSVRVTNSSGVSADVWFVWETPATDSTKSSN